jgi:hypothetical protein
MRKCVHLSTHAVNCICASLIVGYVCYSLRNSLWVVVNARDNDASPADVGTGDIGLTVNESTIHSNWDM